MTKTTNLNETVLTAFQKRVNTLTADREEWQTTVYATANESLYELLGAIYTLYLEAKDGSDVDADKYDWLLSEVQSRKIPTAKTPTFIQLATKLVFFDGNADSRRVNTYARVLSCAAQEGVGTGNAIASYISDRGGIEEIRAALAKNTKTPKQRAVEGRRIADAANNIVEIACDEIAQYATDATGQYVVLVGKLNARGNVEVKHVVFEDEVSKERIAGKTVVSGALSNLYTTKAKAAKKTAKREAEEATADKQSSAFNKRVRDEKHEVEKQAA
ncbi:hypothetical protein K3740_05885 [Ruegeria conchae]|uniref:hypothetical protein n=1 Tax=Ruegeria conchae TaxID=981384 RepID=UPI00147A38C1|nr:hypothetical protein [Ruegeria conchae]UWR04220.1 hypothetical protein K3740_05885 [Ruegeria conchae]